MEFTDYLSQAQAIAKSNNSWSAKQAQKQMDFQKMMSDTAHQREVADLKAAGLNPVLSAGSSGASSANGAMGTTDNETMSAVLPKLFEMSEMANITSVNTSKAVSAVTKAINTIGGSINKLASSFSDFTNSRQVPEGFSNYNSSNPMSWLLYSLDRQLKENGYSDGLGELNHVVADRTQDLVDEIEMRSGTKLGTKVKSDLYAAVKDNALINLKDTITSAGKKANAQKVYETIPDIHAFGAYDSTKSSNSSKNVSKSSGSTKTTYKPSGSSKSNSTVNKGKSKVSLRSTK